MDREHEAHLDRVVAQTALGIESRYRAGQSEHGGNLWEKPGMLAHAESEARDGVVYLCTLREQLEALLTEMRSHAACAKRNDVGCCVPYWADKLARILGPAQE